MRAMRRPTRRQMIKLGAAASALPLVHIRTAGAAGSLSIAFWDHWVPDGNEAVRKVRERVTKEQWPSFLTTLFGRANSPRSLAMFPATAD